MLNSIRTIATNAYLLLAKAIDARAALRNGRAVPAQCRTTAIAPEHELSIMAMVYNEATYIKEWIDFHQLLGVDHFYIYDDESTDDLAAVLAPYISLGLVSVVAWSSSSYPLGANGQTHAYAHAISNFGHNSKWMAFIDIDEFLFPVQDDDLRQLLRRYGHLKSLSAYWFMFSFSGHDQRPDGPVTRAYTKRLQFPPPKDIGNFVRVKSIVQPKYVRAAYEAHMFILNRGLRESWNENGEIIIGNYRQRRLCSGAMIRINHYYTKSMSEFMARRVTNRKRACGKPQKSFSETEMHHLQAASVTDETIRRFTDRLFP